MQSSSASVSMPVVAANPSGVPANSGAWLSRVVMVGATFIVVGILWDISWHRTIGRDTFWTPAHIAIQLGGLIGGMTAAWLVIRTTFLGTADDRAGAVKLWGFHGPLGAWVTIWGCLAMLTSAPFDNWWHDAYGLDVKIISPPHAVLALGMWSVVGGCLLLVLRQQNNGASLPGVSPDNLKVGHQPDRWLFIYGAGVLLATASVFLTEMSFPNDQHSAKFLEWSAATYPFYLLGMSRASKFRFGATFVAGVYMLVGAVMAWTLPLFEGHPKLGPIYNPVDRFVPLPFPLLLVVPALGIDLVRNWIGQGRGWLRDALIVFLCAATFVALFAVTQWRFSEFLLSSHAHNWFFAADRHWGYTETPGPWRGEFWNVRNPKDHPPIVAATYGYAFVCALIASTLGLALGNWMTKVRR